MIILMFNQENVIPKTINTYAGYSYIILVSIHKYSIPHKKKQGNNCKTAYYFLSVIYKALYDINAPP